VQKKNAENIRPSVAHFLESSGVEFLVSKGQIPKPATGSPESTHLGKSRRSPLSGCNLPEPVDRFGS
jgi:hypothetical protein